MHPILSEVSKPETAFQAVEPFIYSTISESEHSYPYDGKAALYDALIGNPLYNRIIWGNWPSRYSRFAQKALEGSDRGIVLDAGCGSLVFTQNVYREYDKRPLILQADALNLPFADNAIETLLSFGILHIFNDKRFVMMERVGTMAYFENKRT